MKNKKTFKETFGKNPWDPWSAKAGLDETSEAQLQQYLLSRGINPKYVAKDVKIAHSKSNQFKQWAATHREEVKLDEAKVKPLKIKIKDPTPTAADKLYAKHQEIRKKSGLPHPDYYKELGKTHDIEDDKERMAKQSEIKSKYNVNEDHVAIAMGKQLDDEGSMVLNQLDMIEDAIEELRKVIKDSDMQLPAWVQSKITLASDYMDTVSHYMSSKNEDGMNEEKGPCWKGYTQVGMKKKNGREVPNCVPSEGVPKAKGYKEESVLYDDPKGTLTRVAERKKEMSRSARIIKSLYKKKGVMKEDTYDWEKDDKDTSSYGKQPKLDKSDDKASKVKKESDAAAVLSGGTTLTKQDRDIVELDPRMKTRSNKDAQDADDDNKSK
ncbi:MAG: hypothetical protein EBU90_10170 [Proteobacteria bacterium]|nr:hypothetical protein [Pseudomonadota bacterium]